MDLEWQIKLYRQVRHVGHDMLGFCLGQLCVTFSSEVVPLNPGISRRSPTEDRHLALCRGFAALSATSFSSSTVALFNS